MDDSVKSNADRRSRIVLILYRGASSRAISWLPIDSVDDGNDDGGDDVDGDSSLGTSSLPSSLKLYLGGVGTVEGGITASDVTVAVATKGQ
jgi:hypothetical protein